MPKNEYRVYAIVKTVYDTVVLADTEEQAIELGKYEFEEGQMNHDDFEDEIEYWQAEEV